MVRTIALAAICSAALVTSAGAADAISYPVGPGQEMPVAVADNSTFDWTGFYAGVFGVAESGAGTTGLGAGVLAGANAEFDFYVLGAEVAAYGIENGGATTGYGQVLARGGVLVTENVLAYATAGYGLDLGAGTSGDALVGAGVEVGVTEDLSLRAQYLRSVPTQGGAGSDQLSVGAVFHF